MKKPLVLLAVLLLLGGNTFAANGDLTVNGNFNLLPAGTMVMYGGAAAPGGWLLADGSAVSRTTYATLFAAIGTTYGAGDGVTTFNLPDFRGVFPKGAGATNRAAGKDSSGNYYAGALGAYSQDQMQGHIHQTSIPVANYASYSGAFAGGNAGQYAVPYLNSGSSVSDGTNGSPRTGHTTEPQSLGVNFLIKY
jgi:microcystin-dependent protein